MLVEGLNFFHSSLVIGFVCFRTDFSLLGIWHSFCSTQVEIKTKKGRPPSIAIQDCFTQQSLLSMTVESDLNLDRTQPGMMQRGEGNTERL